VIDDNPQSQKHNGWHCCDLQPQGPRSRAFYYSRNSLLHTLITYYTQLPMKVPITPHRLENCYYAPPPITITGNRLTPLRGGCRLQDRGAMQGQSESRQHVVAHRRGGREVRLARGGIREHDTFLGHEMRGPARTGRGGVSMAGGREGQGVRKGNGVRGHRLPSPPCFV